MPRWLRISVYCVLLLLSSYMYWISGQKPSQIATPIKHAVLSVDPLRPSASLNITRNQITKFYERRPFNLVFKYVPLADGRPRIVGRSIDGSTLLEVIGPPEKITTVSLMAYLPIDQPLVRLKNLNAVSMLFELTLADWANRDTWLDQNIDQAFAGLSAKTLTSGRSITMTVASQTETLVVNIMGPPL
ncbi:MAG: hypothetical protein ACJZ9F_02150 [Rhodospirillaceae bacterium]